MPLLMRDVIQEFKACDPAVSWSGDMSVQEGYEVCTEPGWLMLLLFQLRNKPHSIGFDHAVKAAYECIKPALHLTSDSRLLRALGYVTYHPHPVGDDLKRVEGDREYATSRADALYATIRDAAFLGLHANEVAEMYLCKVVDMMLGCITHQDNVPVSSGAAHAAIDFVIMALTTETYPDFVAKTFNAAAGEEDMVKMRTFKLAKKIQICKVLRAFVPQPLTQY